MSSTLMPGQTRHAATVQIESDGRGVFYPGHSQDPADLRDLVVSSGVAQARDANGGTAFIRVEAAEPRTAILEYTTR